MTFEKGVEIVCKWIAIFSTIGEWCVILLRELLKALPTIEAQKKLTVIQLESCLALPFPPDPMGEENSPQDPRDDFHVLHITPDTFASWFRACESAAGISKEDISLDEVTIPPVNDVVGDSVQSHSKGVFPKPQRVKTPYVPKSREMPVSKRWGSGEGFG